MTRENPAGRNVHVDLPTGDAGEIMVARVANTLLAGVRFHRDALDKAMALKEIDQPGLLVAPVAWGEGFMMANLYEAGSVRQCLEEMSGHEEDPGERRFGNLYAFTLGGLNRKHLRCMAKRMRELFPGADFFCAGDILPGTSEADICEAEDALSCIELLAPILKMPSPRQTVEA